jgi:DNA polymerase-3 subunit delta
VGKALSAYRKLFESVKKGTVHDLYLLYGPEEYLKREFIKELTAAALPDQNRAFNLDIIYGDEFERHAFDDRINSYPLFTDRRMVILRNYKDLSTANKDYVNESLAVSNSSLVVVVETPNEKLDTARLRTLSKTAESRGLSFNFLRLDERETIERISGRFRREGFEIESGALDTLVESVGTQLIDIGNEVEKIMLAAGESRQVTTQLVTDVVGKYRTEHLFSLLDVIASRNPGVLVRKLNKLIDGGEEPVFILTMLLRRVVLLMEVVAIVSQYGKAASSGKGLADRMATTSSPFYADVLRRQATNFDKAALNTLLENLRWADLKLKSTALDSKTVIEEALLASHLGKSLAPHVY